MRRLALFLTLTALTGMLTACGGAVPGTKPVDAAAVLKRVVATAEHFDAYLRRYEYKTVDDPMFTQLSETIERELNLAPAIHPTRITTQIRKDASIAGYGDLNGNGIADHEEPKLFTIEFDPDNNRIIVTAAAYGQSLAQVLSGRTGLFAGVFLPSLMARQRQAGIQPGQFNSRKVGILPIQVAEVADDKRKKKRPKPKPKK